MYRVTSRVSAPAVRVKPSRPDTKIIHKDRLRLSSGKFQGPFDSDRLYPKTPDPLKRGLHGATAIAPQPSIANAGISQWTKLQAKL